MAARSSALARSPDSRLLRRPAAMSVREFWELTDRDRGQIFEAQLATLTA
jgi:hypothetical protein